MKIADSSLKRLKDRVREIVVGNAARDLGKTIAARNPVLHGWVSYFRLTEVKGGGRNWTGGYGANCAACYGGNGRDRPPATSDCKHAAYPKRFFDVLGLVSLRGTQQRLPACLMNRRMRNRTYGGVRGRRG